ncbi:hypothetical protein [Bradyrhizobium sp.]|uniref:hypothetical protein n=1 Tax=Bradyrhizobium sp. TaxID=376 RepID=UPI003C75833B
MHRALEREGLAEDRHSAGYVLHREKMTERVVGRVLDKEVGLLFACGKVGWPCSA